MLSNKKATKMSELKTFFETAVEKKFIEHRNDSHIEFEFRLGKINRKTFDTNIGLEKFNKIRDGLLKYKGWESIKKTSDTVYFKDSIRLTIDDETEDQVLVTKNKFFKNDYTHKPLDIRFSIASETPLLDQDSEIEYTDSKQRTRESFIRKNLSIDLTIVTGQVDIDSEEDKVYQVEFEIIDPKSVCDANDLYNIVYKIQDVLRLLMD
jgi:hypothetical protein